jgi:hypothetical protein
LTKGEGYQWARPALVANKTRAMQLQAGHPQQKGSRRGPAYAYNIKALRDREMLVAAQAERSYQRFVSQWTAMCRNLAAARLSADCPSGNAPTTRVRRLISRRMRSNGLFVRMRRASIVP